MIKTTVKTEDGRTVTRLRPENEEDIAELQRMADEQELDDDDSFGDEFTDETTKPGAGGGP